MKIMLKIIKRNIRYVVIFLVILIISFIVFGIIDIIRFKNGKEPIFIVNQEHLNDGGTVVYYGIGYQLIEWKQIDDSVISDIVYLTGKECHVLFFVDINEGPTIQLDLLN